MLANSDTGYLSVAIAFIDPLKIFTGSYDVSNFKQAYMSIQYSAGTYSMSVQATVEPIDVQACIKLKDSVYVYFTTQSLVAKIDSGTKLLAGSQSQGTISLIYIGFVEATNNLIAADQSYNMVTFRRDNFANIK